MNAHRPLPADAAPVANGHSSPSEVVLSAGGVTLAGDLTLPSRALGLVVFAHGSGSSRHSPRNRHVADTLADAGLATLLFDLLTRDEEAAEAQTRHLRFDIGLLADRLGDVIEWSRDGAATRDLPVGIFGASTGAAGALVVAARHPDRVRAVVSRGGRPDLAGAAVLPHVRCPTLLVVGGADGQVLALNRWALSQMRASAARLDVIPDATHLFEEPGALGVVARLAREWFVEHVPFEQDRD